MAMMRAAIVLSLLWAVSASPARADDAGGCTVTTVSMVSPDQGTVSIDCTGLSEASGRQLADILTRILKNRLDPQMVLVKLDEVDDWLGDYPGEMRGITYAIGAEQVAITHRRMPQHTGSKGSYGHRHKTQEEIVFVLSGKLQFKLNDEVIELGKYDAIRIPPETWRGIWNDEPEDAEIVIVSKRIDDPTGDTEQIADFWE